MDWREEKVLEYIQTNPTCNKTEVKDSMPFAHRTTDKIIKKLIEEDEKVTFYKDKVNPRIHHLLINDKDKSAIMNQFLRSTSVEVAGKGWISYIHNEKFPVQFIDETTLDIVKKILAGTKWF